MVDYNPDYENPPFDDGSPLAEAEIDMIKILNKEQCEAVAAWLKLYGCAFAKQSPQCGNILKTNFSYAANRLEILGKNGIPDEETID